MLAKASRPWRESTLCSSYLLLFDVISFSSSHIYEMTIDLLHHNMDASADSIMRKIAYRLISQATRTNSFGRHILSPNPSMTIPCPVKLASPCSWTHITRSPGLHSVSPAR